MTKLQEYLASLRPGEVPEPTGFDRLLAETWAVQEVRRGWDGGVQAPGPHGAGSLAAADFVLRSRTSRWQGHGVDSGELQHWEVDVDKRTAQIVKTGHRQLDSMAPRVSVKELAEEIAERILSGEDDERIKRLEDGSVKVLVSEIFPTGSGFRWTVSGRRKRLVQYVAERLSQERWIETVSNVFKPQSKAHRD